MHPRLSCLLVCVRVYQQVELFALCWGLGSYLQASQAGIRVPNWDKGDQRRTAGFFTRDKSFWLPGTAGNKGDLSGGYEWGNTVDYKGHVWEARRFIGREVRIKCLFIEVITLSPHHQAWPLLLSSGAPKLWGQEDVPLPQFAGSSQLSCRGRKRRLGVVSAPRVRTERASGWPTTLSIKMADRQAVRKDFYLWIDPLPWTLGCAPSCTEVISNM